MPHLAHVPCASLCVLVAVTCAGAALAYGDQPVAAAARPAACGLLEYFGEMSAASQFVSGQNLGHAGDDQSDAFHDNVVRLRQATGRWPAILSVDYGFDEIPHNLRPTTDLLALHADHGGIVMGSMHPANPWRGTTVHDRKIGKPADLLNPKTTAGKQWRKDLSRIADSLARLRDHGTIVLWRPLHEMNGDWFWWGKRSWRRGFTAADYVSVWQDMFHYFTRERKLDNLLWVYSPAVQTGNEISSVLDYYPGATFVDMVALDWYDDRLDNLDEFGSYTELLQLNKPLGLAEVGPRNRRDGTFDNLILLQRLKKDYPRIGFFVFWHSWPGAQVAMVDNLRPVELLTHDLVIDRDELPQFRNDQP